MKKATVGKTFDVLFAREATPHPRAGELKAIRATCN